MMKSLMAIALGCVLALVACRTTNDAAIKDITTGKIYDYSYMDKPEVRSVYRGLRNYQVQDVNGVPYVFERSCGEFAVDDSTKRVTTHGGSVIGFHAEGVKQPCSDWSLNRMPLSVLETYLKWYLIAVAERWDGRETYLRGDAGLNAPNQPDDAVSVDAAWQVFASIDADAIEKYRLASFDKKLAEDQAALKDLQKELKDALTLKASFTPEQAALATILDEKLAELETEEAEARQLVDQKVKARPKILAGMVNVQISKDQAWDSFMRVLQDRDTKIVLEGRPDGYGVGYTPLGFYAEGDPAAKNGRLSLTESFIYKIAGSALTRAFFWYRETKAKSADFVAREALRKNAATVNGNEGTYKLLGENGPVKMSLGHAMLEADDEVKFGNVRILAKHAPQVKSCEVVFGKGYRVPTYDELAADADKLIGSKIAGQLHMDQLIWTSEPSAWEASRRSVFYAIKLKEGNVASFKYEAIKSVNELAVICLKPN